MVAVLMDTVRLQAKPADRYPEQSDKPFRLIEVFSRRERSPTGFPHISR